MKKTLVVLSILYSISVFGPAVITPDGRDQFSYWQNNLYIDAHPVGLSKFYGFLQFLGFSPETITILQAIVLYSCIGMLGSSCTLIIALMLPIAPQAVLSTKDIWLTSLLIISSKLMDARKFLIPALASIGATVSIRYNAAALAPLIGIVSVLVRPSKAIQIIAILTISFGLAISLNTCGNVQHHRESRIQLDTMREKMFDDMYPGVRSGSIYETYSNNPSKALRLEIKRLKDWATTPSTYTVVPDSDLVAGRVNQHTSKTRELLSTIYSPSIFTTPAFWIIASLFVLLMNRSISSSIPLLYMLTIAVGLPYGISHFRFIFPSVVLCICYIPDIILRLAKKTATR